MKTLYFKRSKGAVVGKGSFMLKAFTFFFLFCFYLLPRLVSAQEVLFDFNNAPIHTSLPISLTEGGITAHFSATGEGFSIQDNTSPVVPIGFTGRYIYPKGVFLADLLIKFDQVLTDFSIKYSSHELGCDDAGTLRVTVFMKGSLVGTNTKTATFPGTWPVDTLKCSLLQGFDSVVVHYDKRPLTCQDYGVEFLADDMRVIALVTYVSAPKTFIERLTIPNPLTQSSNISFSLPGAENVNVAIYDITGRLIKNVFDGPLSPGTHQLNLDLNDDAFKNSVYFLNLAADNLSKSYKLVLLK